MKCQYFLAVRVDVTDWQLLEVSCAGDAGLLNQKLCEVDV